MAIVNDRVLLHVAWFKAENAETKVWKTKRNFLKVELRTNVCADQFKRTGIKYSKCYVFS